MLCETKTLQTLSVCIETSDLYMLANLLLLNGDHNIWYHRVPDPFGHMFLHTGNNSLGVCYHYNTLDKWTNCTFVGETGLLKVTKACDCFLKRFLKNRI